jgi:hypothetical protein
LLSGISRKDPRRIPYIPKTAQRGQGGYEYEELFFGPEDEVAPLEEKSKTRDFCWYDD